MPHPLHIKWSGSLGGTQFQNRIYHVTYTQLSRKQVDSQEYFYHNLPHLLRNNLDYNQAQFGNFLISTLHNVSVTWYCLVSAPYRICFDYKVHITVSNLTVWTSTWIQGVPKFLYYGRSIWRILVVCIWTHVDGHVYSHHPGEFLMEDKWSLSKIAGQRLISHPLYST